MTAIRNLPAFSVRILFPDGEPNGIRVIEKSNWTGLGISFPRTHYRRVRSRQEIDRTGIYVLWGELDDEADVPTAYVGQGDGIKARLDAHAKAKDFWSHAVVFTSSDQRLNTAHVRHIESRLLRLARDARQCALDNANFPEPPPLGEADKAEAELFLADILLCLPVIGVDFFTLPDDRLESQELLLNVSGTRARGYEHSDGFVVRAGSFAVKDERPGIHPYMSRIRSRLIADGLLEESGDRFRLSADYRFGSPSTASGVLLGRTSNGLTDWKTREGTSIKDLRRAVAEID